VSERVAQHERRALQFRGQESEEIHPGTIFAYCRFPCCSPLQSRLATRVRRIGGAFQSTPLQRVPWLQDDSPLAVASSSQPRLIATLLTGKSEVVAIPNCRRKCEFDRRCETVSRVFPEEGIAEVCTAQGARDFSRNSGHLDVHFPYFVLALLVFRIPWLRIPSCRISSRNTI
jgi:hypothetical protein